MGDKFWEMQKISRAAKELAAETGARRVYMTDESGKIQVYMESPVEQGSKLAYYTWAWIGAHLYQQTGPCRVRKPEGWAPETAPKSVEKVYREEK